MQQVHSGSEVKLHYAISLADGTQVVSTYDEAPIVCKMGDGTFAERLELCLLDMSEGDEAVFTLSGNEVFGPVTEDNLHLIAVDTFPTEMSLTVGQIIAFETPGGDELAGTIKNLNDSEAVVDFNHPLSGRTISFKVKILEVINSATDQSR
jgi:FKBP-type peptidyl-prolyl cis-trans isomerase SlpA